MTRSFSRFILAGSALFFATTSFHAAFCQQTAQLPDSPSFMLAANEAAGTYSSSVDPDAQATTTVQQRQDAPDFDAKQSKRILGIIPNFRSVSASQHLPPQSVKEKFITASQDSFDYSSVVVPALIAGYDMARNDTPEFRQGAIGYGRYFWHSALDQTSENYFVEFIVPAIAHEDTRYYTLGKGGGYKRTVYALKHVIITRDDAGKNVFNAGEVIGSAMSAGLSNAYYPSAERSFGNTGSQWGLDIGIDAATFVFREFWPDINHKFFHDSGT